MRVDANHVLRHSDVVSDHHRQWKGRWASGKSMDRTATSE